MRFFCLAGRGLSKPYGSLIEIPQNYFERLCKTFKSEGRIVYFYL